jgi:hypothetical protein
MNRTSAVAAPAAATEGKVIKALMLFTFYNRVLASNHQEKVSAPHRDVGVNEFISFDQS